MAKLSGLPPAVGKTSTSGPGSFERVVLGQELLQRGGDARRGASARPGSRRASGDRGPRRSAGGGGGARRGGAGGRHREAPATSTARFRIAARSRMVLVIVAFESGRGRRSRLAFGRAFWASTDSEKVGML